MQYKVSYQQRNSSQPGYARAPVVSIVIARETRAPDDIGFFGSAESPQVANYNAPQTYNCSQKAAKHVCLSMVTSNM